MLRAAPRTSTHTAGASKLRQSLRRVELPQAALSCPPWVVCADKEVASWSKHTHTHIHTEKNDRGGRQKEDGGMGDKQWSVITAIICLTSDSVICKQCVGLYWDLLNGHCGVQATE